MNHGYSRLPDKGDAGRPQICVCKFDDCLVGLLQRMVIRHFHGTQRQFFAIKTATCLI